MMLACSSMVRSAAMLASLILFGRGSAAGQVLPPAETGEEVRWIAKAGTAGGAWSVAVPARYVTGTVVAWRAGTLVVAIKERNEPVSIYLEEFDDLEVRRPVPATAEGAVLGGLSGALIGGTIGYVAPVVGGCDEGDLLCEDLSRPMQAIVGVAIGAVAGSALGAIIGSNVRVVRWRSVWIDFSALPPRGIQFAVRR